VSGDDDDGGSAQPAAKHALLLTLQLLCASCTYPLSTTAAKLRSQLLLVPCCRLLTAPGAYTRLSMSDPSPALYHYSHDEK
jgi:hypothetical protein